MLKRRKFDNPIVKSAGIAADMINYRSLLGVHLDLAAEPEEVKVKLVLKLM